MLGANSAAQASNALLQALRERLGCAHNSFDLPAPPALPAPAGEDALRARGVRMQRAALTVETGGDSFLRAAAPELGVANVDAYCAAQRPAVVGALEACTQLSVTDALAAARWPGSRDNWARTMLQPATPFDALALMLWSLLNDRQVFVLGAERVSDDAFDACSASECVTVGQAGAGWVGFDVHRRMGVLNALPQPRPKRAREGSPDVLPPSRRLRKEGAGRTVALPVEEPDPAREALLDERQLLKARLRQIETDLRRDVSTCFYLVRHPMDAFKTRGYLERLRRKQRELIETQNWVVVGFGRTEYALQAYSNGQNRLDGEFFAQSVKELVYAFRREDVLVWQEEADDVAAGLERLLKAVLAFTLRSHAPARDLRDHLRGINAVCAFSHPACCTLKLGGWVDETLLMHPGLWEALLAKSEPHELLDGGRLLTCDAHTLQDALLPATARGLHAKLNSVWAPGQSQT